MRLSKIQDPKSSIIFIVGPTASGKSSLAMKLAKKLGGEIVCADSQTIRRGMDIGTAKPSNEDRTEITHHLIDIIEPYQTFSVSQFKELANLVIAEIRSRGNVPIIVGGSGLYINALYFDFEVEKEDENSKYKAELNKKTVEELQKIIKTNDYEMPNNAQNSRHLIGVILRKGEIKCNQEPIENSFIYGIKISDDDLKSRISRRVEDMFENGLLDETERLLSENGRPPQKIDAIGYLIVVQCLDSSITISQAKEQLKRAHWQYVRKQRAWFKRNEHINWLDGSSGHNLGIIINELNH